MTNPLGFDLLKDILYRRIRQLPDHRQGSPTPDTLSKMPS